MHTPRRGADRDAGGRTTRGVMSSVFGPAEEQALPEEARVRHVCLYPAWRPEQLGAFLSQPPLRLIRGRMTSRGRAAGVARERRWGAPECEPCEKHARLGVHMDTCVCVCARWQELQREIAPSRMEPAISRRGEESASMPKTSQVTGDAVAQLHSC